MRLRDYMEEDDVEQIAKRVEAIRRQRDEQKTLMDELIEIDALDGTTDAVLQATEKHHQQKKQKQQQQQQQLPASIPPKAPRTPALAPQNGSGAHIVAQVVEEPATASSPTRDTGTVSPRAASREDRL